MVSNMNQNETRSVNIILLVNVKVDSIIWVRTHNITIRDKLKNKNYKTQTSSILYTVLLVIQCIIPKKFCRSKCSHKRSPNKLLLSGNSYTPLES